MPPKQKITREMILQTGYDLVKKKGIESVNSRNVSKLIGCSTQPIFSQFPTMEELRLGVHEYACKKFEEYVLTDKDSKEFMKKSYIKVISLARTDPSVFQLIYLSKYCKGKNLMDVRMNYESNQLIYKEIQARYKLDEEDCKDVLARMSIFVHGIATFIATSNISYSDDEVIRITEHTLEEFINGTQK